MSTGKRKPKYPFNAYLVIMQGQGDTEVKLVDKEIWDWFHSPRPPFADDAYFDELPIAPRRVREAILKLNPDEQELGVTSGSWENDRMLRCPDEACLYHEYGDTSSIRAAERWAKKNNYRIVEREEGSIY